MMLYLDVHGIPMLVGSHPPTWTAGVPTSGRLLRHIMIRLERVSEQTLWCRYTSPGSSYMYWLFVTLHLPCFLPRRPGLGTS